MSVHITRVEKSAHGFTMLAEQDVTVGIDVVDEAFSRPAALGRWFDMRYEWPTSMDEPMNVGTALEFTAAVGLLRYEFIMIVADRVLGESLMLRTTKGVVDATVEYTWEEIEGGARVFLEGEFRLRGAQWWRSAWSRRVARHAVVRALERMRVDLFSLTQTPTPAHSGASGGVTTPHGVQGGDAARVWGAHRRTSGRHRVQNA